MFGDLSRRHGTESPPIDTRPAGDAGPDAEFREGVLEVIRAVHNYSRRPEVGTWKAHASVLDPGVPKRIAANPQRHRLLIAPDATNTAVVFVATGEFGNNPAQRGAPTFPLNAVGQPPAEFHTTSDIWLICNAAALVYVREELWAPVRSAP